MMLGPYEGPKERDIHFALANARMYSNEWDINVNSDYELTNDDGCPADAKQIIETALRELSEAKPCECSKCLVPCKKRQCARCGNAIYCSAACQKRDWKAHKPFWRRHATVRRVLVAGEDVGEGRRGGSRHVVARA